MPNISGCTVAETELPSAGPKLVPSPSTKTRWILSAGHVALAIPFLLLAYGYLSRDVASWTFPNDTTFPESSSTYAFWASLHGGRIYLDPKSFPWNAQMYGPLFYMLGQQLAKICGGSIHAITVLGRVLATACLIGCAGLISCVVRKLEGSWKAAVLPGIMCLGCVFIDAIGSSVRPDLLSTLVLLVAVFCFLESGASAPGLLLVGLLIAVSVLLKQSQAPLLVAFLVPLGKGDGIRRGGLVLSGFLATTACVVLYLVFRQEPFAENLAIISHGVLNRASIPSWTRAILRANTIALWPICLGMLGAVVSWRSPRYRFLSLLLLLSWVSNLAALANVGGAGNYLIVPYLISLLLLPAAVPVFSRYALPGALAFVLIALGSWSPYLHGNYLAKPEAVSLHVEPLEKLTMLADIPYLEVSSREPQLFDPFFYHQLELTGAWAVSPVIERIDTHHYDVILMSGKAVPSEGVFLLNSGRGIAVWDPAIASAVRQRYKVLCRVQLSDQSVFAFVRPQDDGRAMTATVSATFARPCSSTNMLPILPPNAR